MLLNNATLEKIQLRLSLLNDFFDEYRKFHRIHSMKFEYSGRLTDKEIYDFSYFYFMFRFIATCKNIIHNLDNLLIKDFAYVEHSCGIALRASLLDTLYILAWRKDKSLINCFLSESYEAIRRNKVWNFSENEKLKLKRDGAYFKGECKNDIGTASLVTLANSEIATGCYYQYDVYSKYDHFGIAKFVLFPFPPAEQLANIDTSLFIITQGIQELVQLCEVDSKFRTDLLRKLAKCHL